MLLDERPYSCGRVFADVAPEQAEVQAVQVAHKDRPEAPQFKFLVAITIDE